MANLNALSRYITSPCLIPLSGSSSLAITSSCIFLLALRTTGLETFSTSPSNFSSLLMKDIKPPIFLYLVLNTVLPFAFLL